MHGRLLGWCLAAVLGSSCAGGRFRRPPPRDPVQLKAAGARFPTEGRGEFRLDLEVPNPKGGAGKVTGIDWELWLNNRWFASGTGILNEDIPTGGGLVHVTLPVAFGRLPTSTGPVSLMLSVRGNLTARLGGSDEQLAFSGASIVQATNAPLVEKAIAE